MPRAYDGSLRRLIGHLETVCLKTVLSGQASVRMTMFFQAFDKPLLDIRPASADEFNKWVHRTRFLP